MTRDSAAEIVIVGAAGIFVLYLWGRNRAAGAGTGLDGFPSLTSSDAASPGAPGFAIPSPVPGFTATYDQPAVALPGLPDFTLANGVGASCDCAGSGNLASTFGSNADLTAWLATQPTIMAPYADAQNWY